MVAPVEFKGDRLSVHFRDFGAESYPRFLQIKALPEYEIEYLPDETYRITAPARFAAMLGVQDASDARPLLPISPFLFDDQQAIVGMALKAKRFACWANCGLGKTLIGLEFARQVVAQTGGRFLIFTRNDLVSQWLEMAAEFYGDALPVMRISSRQQMKDWAAGKLPDAPMIAIVNYEKMNFRGPGSDGQQTVNELRYLAGVAVDENPLKAGGGKQKWALIKSCKGIEFKLTLTATPAPNDTIEFASQASFLEKMRSDGEIIWTYFQRNEKTHRWDVKPHAREGFFEVHVELVNLCPRSAAVRLAKELPRRAQAGRNAIERNKLSQVAKGFIYLKRDKTGKLRASKSETKRICRIASLKPEFVARLFMAEIAAGYRPLLWTVFDAESDLIIEELHRLGCKEFDSLHGRHTMAQRAETLERYRHGHSRGLITKGSLLGWGMNFQHCKSMIFSGFDDSYEKWFQQIARAVRYLQDAAVRVHLPVIEELEGDMLENLLIKQERHEASITAMEDNYIAGCKALGVLASAA
jgi:hypothetical protein